MFKTENNNQIQMLGLIFYQFLRYIAVGCEYLIGRKNFEEINQIKSKMLLKML